MKKAIILSVTLSVLLLLVIGYKLVHRVEPISPIVTEETIPIETETPDVQEVTAIVEESRETVDGGEIVKFSDGTNEQKEVYDNPIIQADSETYIEYLGKTMSLKEYYEEVAQVDPERLVRGGDIERLIAYNPNWASEHGYSLEDVQQPEPEKPATTNIEDNHITPAPDPSLIEDTTSEDEIPQWAADRGLGKPVADPGPIDWGSVPPELRPTFK